MRVSPFLAALCGLLMISCIVAADSDNHLRGRSLHPLPDETKSVQGYTKTFCSLDICHGEDPVFEDGNLVGLAIGFTVTGIFMTFGVVVIIRDEMHRVVNYNADLDKDRAKLRGQGVDAATMQSYDQEFFTRENTKKKSAAELEKERLELMAKN